MFHELIASLGMGGGGGGGGRGLGWGWGVGEVEYNTTKIYMNFVSLGLSKCLAF